MKVKIIKIMGERDKCKVSTEGLVLAWLRSRKKVTVTEVSRMLEKRHNVGIESEARSLRAFEGRIRILNFIPNVPRSHGSFTAVTLSDLCF